MRKNKNNEVCSEREIKELIEALKNSKVDSNTLGCCDCSNSNVNPDKIHIDPLSDVANIYEHKRIVFGDTDVDSMDPLFSRRDIINDNTAMTNMDKRGTVPYVPYDFEDTLPEPIRSNVLQERVNNTFLVEDLMAIEEDAIRKKAAIDYEAKKLQYETLAEYMTQAGMHRSSTIMCRIAQDCNKNNK